MLPKKHRLVKPDIFTVLRNGKKLLRNAFLCRHLSSQDKASKFAIILSTKKTTCAVTRSRIKRILRNAIVSNLEACRHSTWIVITYRVQEEQRKEDINKDIRSLFEDISLMYEKHSSRSNQAI